MKIAVAGATGRMGRAVLTTVCRDARWELAGVLARPGSPACGQDAGLLVGGESTGVLVSASTPDVIGRCDVLVDFTQPEAALEYAAVCAQLGKPAVIGTTGLSEAAYDKLRLLAQDTALVVAANMSIGVNLALYLLEIASRVLGEADVEVFEAHHRHKVDSPSGTALRMGEVVARARGQELRDVAVYARSGTTGPRVPGTIGFASLRAGEIVGEHRVFLALASERLEIAHVAESREVFAEGALRAAQFLVGRGPGFFDMQDVLGLR